MLIRKLVFALALGVVAIAVLAVFNPGNFLSRRSESYTTAAFEHIGPGDSAQSVVTSLGEPIEIRSAGVVGDCSECSVYVFLGNAPKWVFRYEEAWVLVDKQGVVVKTVRTREP